MTASMMTRVPGNSPGRLGRAAARAGRAAFVGVGAGAVIALTASASFAAVPSETIAEGQWSSKATAQAVDVSLAGQVADEGVLVALSDGVLETAKGIKTPELPVLGEHELFAAGLLAQDAIATKSGYAAACAGVVANGGAIQLGPDKTCLMQGDGTFKLSLGSLQQLGLGSLLSGQLPGLEKLAVPGLGQAKLPAVGQLPTGNLPLLGGEGAGDLTGGLTGTLDGLTGDLTGKVTGEVTGKVTGEATGKVTEGLPLEGGLLSGLEGALNLSALDLSALTSVVSDLPSGGLPAIELQLVGRAISAECLGTPSGDVYHKATPIDAQVVAVVAGQQIPIAQLPPEGLSLNLTDVLTTVQGKLPVNLATPLSQVLGSLPLNQLSGLKLVDIAVGEEKVSTGQVSVTGLGVTALYPGMVGVELGKVTCLTPKAPMAATLPAVDADSQASVDAEAQADSSAGVDAKAKAKSDTAVNANLAPASQGTPVAPIGWSAAAAVLLAGIALAGWKLRRARATK